MKKVLSLLMIIIIGGVLFAQSAEYTKLLDSAKQYETKKQYVSALCTYYDAMEADPANSSEALDAYKKLSSVLESGKPGYGNFGKFELHDGWKNILIDAERYWAENPIIGIKINNISQDKLDYATKTATYKIEYEYYFTEKYEIIRNLITTGCKKAGCVEWEDYPKMDNWPVISILNKNDGSFDALYKKYKIPLLKDSDDVKYFSPYYETPVFNLKRYEPQSIQEAGYQSAIMEQIEALNLNFLVNDVKFSVVDGTGNHLFSGTRQLIKKEKNGYVYYLQKVPQNIMKDIDSKRAVIKLTGFYLQYGEIAKKDIYVPVYNSYNRNANQNAVLKFLQNVADCLSDENLRSLVTKLPDISIDINRIEKGKKGNAVEIANKKIEDLKLRNSYLEKIQKAFEKNDFKVVNSLNEEARLKGVCISPEDLGVTEREYYLRENTYFLKESYKEKNFEKAHTILDLLFNNEFSLEEIQLDNKAMTSTYKTEIQKLVKSNCVVEASLFLKYANLIGLENESVGWDVNIVEKSLKAEIQETYKKEDYKRTIAAIDYLTEGLGKRLKDIKLQSDLREMAQKKLDAREAKFAEYRKSIEEKFVEIPDLGIRMSSVEVTQKFYLQIMKKDPSKNKDLVPALVAFIPVSGNSPVDSVTWLDAITFCNELSIKAGLEPAYEINGNEVKWNKSANGYRLPTEKEWFTAAKAKKEYSYSGSNYLRDIAWYSDNSEGFSHTIATKNPNSYGLYDMNGNVWEWIWDVTSKGEHCMAGGGYLSSDSKYFDLDGGSWIPKDASRTDIGFRICRNIN